MINSFKDENAFLSNFHPSPFRWNGLTAQTVEHAFQAWKMTKGQDMLDVLLCPSPGLAKRTARKRPMREDWDKIKVSVMYDLLKRKFEIPELKSLLLATGDQDLVEGNHWGDVYWGKVGDNGKNMLGRLLMLIREELRDA